MIIKKYKKISSTNEIAKKLKPKPWTIILADEQTSGYGKEKRKWFSPEGGLYFTIVLPKLKINDLQTLTILAAFSIAKTIKEKYNLETFVKLPNDVMLLSKTKKLKKIAGILTENIAGKEVLFSIMGIGLNTNIEKFPEDLKDVATSLKIELGKKVENEKILKEIFFEIKKQIEKISK